MATTQLEMVNRVLRRLREDEVTTVAASDYSVLIAEFVNAGIEDVQEAHDWQRFIRTTYAELAGGAQARLDSYEYENGQAYGHLMNENSKITWLDHDIPVIMFSPTVYPTALSEVSDWYPLVPVSIAEWEALQTATSANYQNKVEVPTVCNLRTSSSESLNSTYTILTVWPYTDNNPGCLKLVHWTPQGTLELDGSDDDTLVLAPQRPVFEFALMMGLNERGEEIGEPGNMAERRYFDAISKSIEDDIDFAQRTDKFDWRRD